MKRFLFVLRHAPCEGIALREFLDMLLTVAAFDQPVRILCLDDGVLSLKSGQQPDALGLSPVAPLWQALAIYDVEGVWVEQESLASRHLTTAQLIVPVQPIARAAVAGFIAAADIVVTG